MEGCAGGRVPYTADRRNFCSICGVTVEAARAPTLLIVSSITDFLRYDCACTLCHSHVDSYRQENVTVLSHMFNLKYKSNEQGFWQNTENDIFSFLQYYIYCVAMKTDCITNIFNGTKIGRISY